MSVSVTCVVRRWAKQEEKRGLYVENDLIAHKGRRLQYSGQTSELSWEQIIYLYSKTKISLIDRGERRKIGTDKKSRYQSYKWSTDPNCMTEQLKSRISTIQIWPVREKSGTRIRRQEVSPPETTQNNPQRKRDNSSSNIDRKTESNI